MTSRRDLLKAGLISALAAGSGVWGQPSSAASSGVKDGNFTTNDGVKIHYLEAGSGQPLVFIPGWSQSAAMFKYQLSGLSDRYRIFVLDTRGHGESDKPLHGYHMGRLSQDVREFLVARDLHDVTLAGHSLGVAVVWGYWELYGKDRLKRMVFIDEMPALVANPLWDAKQKLDAGALFDPVSLYTFTNSLVGHDQAKVTRDFVASQFTTTYDTAEIDWVYQENLKLPRNYAAQLLRNAAMTDWRSLIPTIALPTLVFGGKASVVPWQSVVWVAEQIKGSKLEVFGEDEGGSHCMFMENPGRFNDAVRAFMG